MPNGLSPTPRVGWPKLDVQRVQYVLVARGHLIIIFDIGLIINLLMETTC